jgi:hypothetical protein
MIFDGFWENGIRKKLVEVGDAFRFFYIVNTIYLHN